MTTESWKNYARWEGSNIYPIDDQVITEIADSIKQNGYISAKPIILFDGAVLDGWHRYTAAKMVDVEPSIMTFDGSEADALRLILWENGDRRHLSKSSKAAAAILIRRHLARLGEPMDETTADTARRIGLAEGTVGRLESATDEQLEKVADGASLDAVTKKRTKPALPAAKYPLTKTEASGVAHIAHALDIAPKAAFREVLKAGLPIVRERADAALAAAK